MKKITTLIVATAIVLSPVAWGQGTGNKNPGRGGMDGMGAQRPDGPRTGMASEGPASPGAMVYKQLDQLEDELQLTPAQRAAWAAYADALQRLAEAVERARSDARTRIAEPSSAPKQLEAIAAGMQQRAALVQASVDQGQALYAMLSAEQKTIADKQLWLSPLLLATGIAPSTSGGAGGRRP